MNIVDVLINFGVMIAGIVTGSYIYTRLILKYLVRSEIKSIVSEIAKTLNSDGETKDKLKEIVDTVIDEAKLRGKRALIEVIRDVKKEVLSTDDVKVPDFIKNMVGDDD